MDISTNLSKKDKMLSSMLSDDGTLTYDFMTSLQKIVMARIVSILWMNTNTHQKVTALYKRYECVSWSHFFVIEQEIYAKILLLLLPTSVCQELKYLVSVFRNFIVNWVNYHDEHVFIPKKHEYSAINLIHNIMWTARGKIDYLQTAKKILANSDIYLSDDHKYKLACTYCLEEEISLLSSKFVDKFYLSRIHIDREPMVYFWTAQVTNDMTQLNNPQYSWDINRRHDTMNIQEHILQLLMKRFLGTCDKTVNDIPIRFMWRKLSIEEKAKNFTLFKNVNNPDLIISLLTNFDNQEQQNILKKCSDEVLCAILNDWWWWGDYFLPTALHALDIMDPLSFWKILRELNRKKSMCSEKNIYDNFKSLFNLLWQKSSTEFKEFIFYAKTRSLNQFVIYELDWEQDLDVLETVLKDLSAEQKENIAFSADGMERCAYFIQHNKWDSLDLFIKGTLSSDEVISQWKQRLIQECGKTMAITFLREREFHKMERFLTWAFESEEEISNFCQSLNYAEPHLTQ